MINTRVSIFKTLKRRIRELTRHANQSPKEFKRIMLAVILNDLKEWSEYIPQDDPNMIVDKLNTLILNSNFIIERMPEHQEAYMNVNTPQTNNTWQRIWDRKHNHTECSPEIEDPKCVPWEIDPRCEPQIVYFNSHGFPKATLKELYGIYGEKLKTVCEKMNIFIDRDTEQIWYLDPDTCEWKMFGEHGSNMTDEHVIELIKESRIKVTHSDLENAYAQFDITYDDSDADGKLHVLREEDMEGIV